MKNQKVITKKLVVPQWQAGLFISLFLSDGGNGYNDAEIEQVVQIINEEHLLSLVSVSEPQDDECTLEFIIQYLKKEDMTNENVYEQNGYKDRNDYLQRLAEDNGVDIYIS